MTFNFNTLHIHLNSLHTASCRGNTQFRPVSRNNVPADKGADAMTDIYFFPSIESALNNLPQTGVSRHLKIFGQTFMLLSKLHIYETIFNYF